MGQSTYLGWYWLNPPVNCFVVVFFFFVIFVIIKMLGMLSHIFIHTLLLLGHLTFLGCFCFKPPFNVFVFVFFFFFFFFARFVIIKLLGILSHLFLLFIYILQFSEDARRTGSSHSCMETDFTHTNTAFCCKVFTLIQQLH